jgi:hypothetical protein
MACPRPRGVFVWLTWVPRIPFRLSPPRCRSFKSASDDHNMRIIQNNHIDEADSRSVKALSSGVVLPCLCEFGVAGCVLHGQPLSRSGQEYFARYPRAHEPESYP